MPVDYQQLNEAGKHALVLSTQAPAIAGALLRAEGCTPLNTEGRGQVFRFPSGDGFGVLRRCLRGGLPGRFLRDAYFLRNRPLAEFEIHLALYNAGVPSPQPLGVQWERSGPWYRGAIATRFIEGVSLQSLLAGNPSPTPLDAALRASGQAIRALHDAGGLHADLHPANILLAQGTAFLLDFDRARLLAASTPGQRAANLGRLRRAFIKHGFDLRHYNALLESYHTHH